MTQSLESAIDKFVKVQTFNADTETIKYIFSIGYKQGLCDVYANHCYDIASVLFDIADKSLHYTKEDICGNRRDFDVVMVRASMAHILQAHDYSPVNIGKILNRGRCNVLNLFKVHESYMYSKNEQYQGILNTLKNSDLFC